MGRRKSTSTVKRKSSEPSNVNPNPVERSSTENPPTIDEPSQENPTTVENFSFQLYPAIRMKQAIACLCDEQFNPRGFGVIDVDDIGFEITVRDSASGAVGHLWLDANCLINFKYNKPMTAKRVNLNHIYQNLAAAAVKDTISIHHSDGSNQIVFSFGNDPPTEFSEELLELEVEYEKFPTIVYACHAELLRYPFLAMIRDYEDAPDPKRVSVDISDTTLEITTGRMKRRYGREHEITMVIIKGMGRGQKHVARFQWPDCEFLKKAALVTPVALLCITVAPPRQIMMRFHMRELGDLVFLYGSALTLFNAHLFDALKADATRSNENPNPVEHSSTENPPSIDEPSQEIPTTVENFSFQLYPAMRMKQAIACLCDEQFNPRGFGMIHVDDIGFEITVRDSESGAVGHLWLDATLLSNFKYNKHMSVKWVNLNHIYQNLVDAADQDIISIHHSDGSNQIVFSFGNDPPTEFSEELLELEVEYEKFPKIVYACQAVLLRDLVLAMIKDYEDAPNPKKISADILDTTFKITTGKMKWEYARKHKPTMVRIQGMGRGQKHQAWFQWPDCEFLNKASLLAPGALLCFTIAPPRQIMMRFNMRELGDLVYLYKSEVTLFNAQDFDENMVARCTAKAVPLT
ncbi:hypothetical protein RND81_10G106800 [Saponaria officinalis]|uniref:Proliferating cell nuclear antigen n=1 Tax=Saponaria officinalis TaxID=3572 RepID=A0AAW1I0A6_SAPOF